MNNGFNDSSLACTGGALDEADTAWREALCNSFGLRGVEIEVGEREVTRNANAAGQKERVPKDERLEDGREKRTREKKLCRSPLALPCDGLPGELDDIAVDDRP